ARRAQLAERAVLQQRVAGRQAEVEEAVEVDVTGAAGGADRALGRAAAEGRAGALQRDRVDAPAHAAGVAVVAPAERAALDGAGLAGPDRVGRHGDARRALPGVDALGAALRPGPAVLGVEVAE